MYLLGEGCSQAEEQGSRVQWRGEKADMHVVSAGVWLRLTPPGALEHELRPEFAPPGDKVGTEGG